MINKITAGYVIQTFDDSGAFLKQEFVAEDTSIYEDEDGIDLNASDIDGDIYHPFYMRNKTYYETESAE